MSKQRKHYETAFKLEVARMVVDQGLSIAQVVKDMNIGRTAVNRWIEQYRAEQQGKPELACGAATHPPDGDREPPTAL